MSERKTIGERVLGVMQDVTGVEKDGYNKHHKYAFSSAAGVQRAIRRAMIKHGLWIENCHFSAEGFTGKAAAVRCTLTITDGESSIKSDGLGAGSDSLDKAPMKAHTAAYKYALLSAFCVPMGDDPEADDEADKREDERRKRAAKFASSLPGLLDGVKDGEALVQMLTGQRGGYEALDEADKGPASKLIRQAAERLQVPMGKIKAALAA